MATGINLNAITPYSSGIINLINGILVPVLIAIAFIVFLWGAYKYFIWGAENETEKAEGRKFAMWGIIGFVIILSLWGLVNLVMGAFGLSVGKAPPFPTIGGSTTGVSGSNIPILPGGSQGQITAGTSGGTLSQQQSAALTSLNQQYTISSNTCATYGNQSSECKAAAAAYSRMSQAYSDSYAPSVSGATPAEIQAACKDNGTDPLVCACEAGGGIWELSNGGQCSTNSASQTAEPAPSETTQPVSPVCPEGSDPAACACEAKGGAWDPNNNECSQ